MDKPYLYTIPDCVYTHTIVSNIQSWGLWQNMCKQAGLMHGIHTQYHGAVMCSIPAVNNPGLL